ncbi:MAG TPA: hypothetical protein VM238_22005, partial [Phycisphaerae bacterium]|nr:hypothetical protein [Phycisphaerae bacterium]
VQHGRPSGCRATHGWASQPCHTRGHALPPPAETMATQHQVAMPPAETAAPWSPAASDTTAADSTLAAAGGLVDLLAAPALEMTL